MAQQSIQRGKGSDASDERGGLPKQYRPADHEGRIRELWERSGAFHADPGPVLRAEKRPYAIVIPPPNVTDRLHVGHALNNSLQDVLVRAHRMMGYETLWMPGTDHAGIATQTVVERRVLKEEGKRRTDFSREEFVAKIQAFKDEYEATITGQLKAMGCSCDWARQRFTMDEVCARAVNEAFFRLFRDGLIYRGKRLVNWDPVTQTALADDEVEMEEVEGKFYYLRYLLVHPVVGASGGSALRAENERGQALVPVTWSDLRARGYPVPDDAAHGDEVQAWVTVATTRPETYLGDTAVAVNPRDPRAGALRGLLAELPLVGRVIPIIEDDYVVMPRAMAEELGDEDAAADAKAEFATGFLKVTPAHDPNDYELGVRHDLPMINVMAPDATISDKHGWDDVGDAHIFVGKSREDARELVVKEFKARGLLADTKPYRHSVGHSYRSHAAIEPYLSDQWYVRVTDMRMRDAALRAMAEEQRSGELQEERPDLEGGAGNGAEGGAGLQPASRGTQKPWTDLPVSRYLRAHFRRLPHFQKGGSTYFVTFRIAEGSLSETERQVVLDACMHWHGTRAQVFLAVVMPDHVHMLIKPSEKEPDEWWPLGQLIHSIKRFSAREIGKLRGTTGGVWQDEYFDRIVRDADEFTEKWNYILRNPARKGLAPDPGTYRFIARTDTGRVMQHGTEEFEALRRGELPEVVERRTPQGGLQTRPTSPKEGRAVASDGDGGLRFFPERYAKTYETWHENIRDWCISRQLWWGHRIPVWSITLSDDAGACGDWDIQPAKPVSDFGPPPPAYHETEELLYQLFAAVGLRNHVVIRAQCNDVMWWPELCTRSVEAQRVLAAMDALYATADWPIEEHEQDTCRKVLLKEGFADFAENESAVALFNKLVGRFESGWDRDPDVLDTWFSSALWPMSTMGWPDHTDLLKAFNPTNVLCTAREIITLWVSRMVMFNRYFLPEGWPHTAQQPDSPSHRLTDSPSQGNGPLPFRDVFIHAMIQDGDGRKMSKSLGNGVDPLDIIQSHGADAMRFVLCQMTTQTQDVRMPVVPDPKTGKNTSPKFDIGRNFCNKLWNAARFAIGILEGGETAKQRDSETGTNGPEVKLRELSLPDRWMLSRLLGAAKEINLSVEGYEFSDYAQALYDLMWRDFCDWYLEAIKPTVADDPRQRAVLKHVLECIVRFLHPIAPFITEALWEKLRDIKTSPVPGIAMGPARRDGLLATAAWPVVDGVLHDEDAQRDFERIRGLVTAIREIRAQHNVPPRKRILLHVPAELEQQLGDGALLVSTLAGLERVTTDTPQGPAAAFTFGTIECHISNIAEAVDVEAERARVQKQVEDLRKQAERLQARLDNPGYAEKAPPHMVQQTRDQLAQAHAELASLEDLMRKHGL